MKSVKSEIRKDDFLFGYRPLEAIAEADSDARESPAGGPLLPSSRARCAVLAGKRGPRAGCGGGKAGTEGKPGAVGCPGRFASPKMCGRQRVPELCSTPLSLFILLPLMI